MIKSLEPGTYWYAHYLLSDRSGSFLVKAATKKEATRIAAQKGIKITRVEFYKFV